MINPQVNFITQKLSPFPPATVDLNLTVRFIIAFSKKADIIWGYQGGDINYSDILNMGFYFYLFINIINLFINN